jgi:collagen type XVIII alpha
VFQVLAKFLVPNFAKKWTRFAFRVLDSGLGVPNVTLFFNCIEYGSLLITSVAWKEQLTFDTASTLYIGQAGGLLQPPGEFVVTKNYKHLFSVMTDAFGGFFDEMLEIEIEKHNMKLTLLL